MNRQTAPPFDFSRLLYPLLIAVGILVVYHQTSNFDFVNYDDELYVSANGHLREGLSLNNFSWAFTTFEIGNWHPLTWLSLLFDASQFGQTPASFHSMNVFYHLLNSLILYGLLNYVTKAPFRSFLIAFLFAVHPLHAESVAWISGRKDVLSTLFGFLAIWSYFVYVKRTSYVWYGVMMGCFLLSLLSKQMFVTLPCLLLLLDAWPLKRLRHFRSEEEPKTITGSDPPSVSFLFLEKLPLFALSILFSVVIYLAQQAGGAVQTMDRFPLGLRIQNAILSYGLYIKKTFLPTDLAVIYPHPGEAISQSCVWISLAILVGITLFALFRFRKQPELLVGWLWFRGMLVPVIGLIQLGDEGLADRYMYVPQVGLFLLMCWLIPAEFLKRKPVAVGASCLAIAYCSWMTQAGYQQVATWENSGTLMRQAIAVTENNWKAHHNLAKYLQNHPAEEQAELTMQREEIREHLGAAKRIRPENYLVLSRYANLLRDVGELEQAQELLNKAAELEPNNLSVLIALGNFYQRQNQMDKAIAAYRRAVEAEPEQGLPYVNLAMALQQKNNLKEAFDVALQAEARINTLDGFNAANIYNVLGILNMQARRIDQGLQYFQKAVADDPNHPQANTNLQRALQMQGQMPR
ncbi:MAG: tetratricopeptide repeat protein [Planctomycetaceae bacterium]|nr:tetratricopeptide repeat protein [Planctomycetaceae bacterium]